MGAERLERIGKSLQSGEPISASDAEWLGHALVEIARGEHPDDALGLATDGAEMLDARTTMMAAGWMAYLVHRGLTEQEAAEWVAYRLSIPADTGAAHVLRLYRDLEARRGVFSVVSDVTFHGFSDATGEYDEVVINTPDATLGYAVPDMWVVELGGGLKNAHE